jgi:hypothetical protein
MPVGEELSSIAVVSAPQVAQTDQVVWAGYRGQVPQKPARSRIINTVKSLFIESVYILGNSRTTH